MGAKATLRKLDSIHAAIYTAKASNAAVYILQRHLLCLLIDLNFYHFASYHTGMPSTLLCLHLTFTSYPLFMGLH